MMDTEERVLDVIVEKGRALVERNPSKLVRLLHPSFIYMNAGGKSFDRDAYVGTFCTSKSLLFLDQKVIELVVRPVDDFAVATMLMADRLIIDGIEQSGKVRSMCVFTKANDGWLWAAGQTISQS